MPELNKANRQVCDVDIRDLKTKAPFLAFDTANTTTAGLSGDSVYAMAKGSRRIAFPNPIEGTMTIEAQVYPFKFFSLFSDGVIENNAIYAEKKTVRALADGAININENGTIQTGTVFVYPVGKFGDESSQITGTYANNTFTSSSITQNTEYEIGYLVSMVGGVKRISFNNKKLPKDFFVTMKTVDKDEEGVLTPFVITAYKATAQRTFEVSFSSEGDPATVTLTFDLMEDKDGNILDMVEITGEYDIIASTQAVSVVVGKLSNDIKISGITGEATIAFLDSSGNDYSNLEALLSADNDTLIIRAKNNATAGTYTLVLSDEESKEVDITVQVVAAS